MRALRVARILMSYHLCSSQFPQSLFSGKCNERQTGLVDTNLRIWEVISLDDYIYVRSSGEFYFVWRWYCNSPLMEFRINSELQMVASGSFNGNFLVPDRLFYCVANPSTRSF
jgi:hypothetical protein